MLQVIPVVEDMSGWFFDFNSADAKDKSQTGLKLWCSREHTEIPLDATTDDADQYLTNRYYDLWIDTREDTPSADAAAPPPTYEDFLTNHRVEALHKKWAARPC